MVRKDIFKKEGFWEGRSYKIHIYIFMIILAVSAYVITTFDTADENVLQRVTGAGVVDLLSLESEPEIPVEKDIMFEKGVSYQVGDKTFLVNKIDRERVLRGNPAEGVFWIISFIVTSDKPYVPEPRIISGRNILAPELKVQELYGDKVLKQVEGTTEGLKVFDIPREFKEFYIDFDVNINSTLYRIK